MEKYQNVILPDGHKYSGYGEYRNGDFCPNGFGRKDFDQMYAKGNFVDGVLNGPAIISHDYYMYTMFMKNDRGNGWGLCINGGVLVEFGYYRDSQLKADLTKAVEWYFDKMASSDRAGEKMLNIYTSKADGTVTDLHIGYTGGDYKCFMGFHFLKDGTVWIGTTEKRTPSGHIMVFRPYGYVNVGLFENGELIEEMSIQELIDQYYGSIISDDDEFITAIFGKKSSSQLAREKKREQYNDVVLDTTKNYSIN